MSESVLQNVEKCANIAFENHIKQTETTFLAKYEALKSTTHISFNISDQETDRPVFESESFWQFVGIKLKENESFAYFLYFICV